jgi:hypothetical protein
MPRYKLGCCALGIATALFTGVARLPAQQSSAMPDWLEKAIEPARPPNIVQFPVNIPQPTLAPNNSHVAGPVAPSSFNQTYEQALANARQDCKALWSDRAFETLRDKVPIPLSLDQDKPAWSMLTNNERMRPKQNTLADLTIRALEKCRAAYAPVYSMLPPQVKTMITEGLERKQDALIAELSLGKITFGEYNIAINEMSGEFVRAVSGLQNTSRTPTSPSEPYEILAEATAECKALWSSNTFDTLRKKIPLGDEKPTLAMLTNRERLYPKDRPLADLAIKTLEKCRAAVAPAYAMFPPQIGAMKDGIDRKHDAVIAQLYVGKITFGEYNARMARLYEESASFLSGIPQSNQSNRSDSASANNTSSNTAPVVSTITTQASQPAEPELGASPVRRFALVIGNSNYLNLPKLSNPANDARSINETLQRIGFLTKLVLDASEQDIRREVRKFAGESEKADIAFVFYAGHGAQVNGENYLLPVDIEVARTEADIQLTGFKVDDLVNSIRSNTKIVFLDACRDNPVLFRNLVKGRGAQSAGLAPAVASKLDPGKPGGGIFIAYATDSGSVAQEGEGKHSPFTQALLRNLQKPISIDDMFSLVTKEVRLVTKNTQRPYKYASLESIVCLARSCQGAPSAETVIDPVQQAQRSEGLDLQIALQTNNSDALEAYLQKYPDSQKLNEVLAAISRLRRSEFNEWTLYEIANLKLPQSFKLSSIEQFGSRVAVRQRFLVDPSQQPKEQQQPDAAYHENITVFDCENPIMATAETTTLSKSGETLYHYKWGDPRYLNLSIGVALSSGMVGLTARRILCHEQLRTPLVKKSQLTSMAFSSLSSTLAGDGDIFYAPIANDTGTQDQKEALLIIRFNNERPLKFPNVSIDLPNFQTEVNRVTFQCTDNKFFSSKSEDYDASNNLVYLTALDPSGAIQWNEFVETSPVGMLRQIFCHKEFSGIGVQVTVEDNSIKVTRVMDEKPAAKAGVKVDDLITYLDGKSVDGLTLNQAIEKLRGPPNSKVKLGIVRKGEDSPIELSITREMVQADSRQGQAQK